MKKLLIVALALAVVVTMLAVPAAADGPADYDAAVKKAADRLVDLQGTTDGGWDWIVTDLTAHSGTYPSPGNILGVTALGLIDAYQETGASSYLTAAGRVADMMKAYAADYEGFRAANMGQSWDLRFLEAYAKETGDTSYSDFAEAYWDWVKAREAPNVYADGNQEDFYQFYITYGVSPGYAMWDVADFGLAALAVDDTTWASAMAVVVNSHLGEIVESDEWRFIGWGKALELLNAVDSTAYATEIASLITNLTGSQNANGSWPGSVDQGKVQNTAYVVMGLAAAGEGASARRGADWLVENQITSGDSIGGWIETDSVEYSEVDSEALQAIKSVLDISRSVSMAANIPAIVCISVSPPSLDWGTITVPWYECKTVKVSNEGTVAVTVTHEVTGDTLFTTYLGVTKTSENIGVDGDKDFSACLNVHDYTPQGVETGTIIFWAEQM